MSTIFLPSSSEFWSLKTIGPKGATVVLSIREYGDCLFTEYLACYIAKYASVTEDVMTISLKKDVILIPTFSKDLSTHKKIAMVYGDSVQSNRTLLPCPQVIKITDPHDPTAYSRAASLYGSLYDVNPICFVLPPNITDTLTKDELRDIRYNLEMNNMSMIIGTSSIVEKDSYPFNCEYYRVTCLSSILKDHVTIKAKLHAINNKKATRTFSYNQKQSKHALFINHNGYSKTFVSVEDLLNV